MEQKRCISSFTLAELTAELKAMGQPGFRAKQIFHWVHQKLVTQWKICLARKPGCPSALSSAESSASVSEEIQRFCSIVFSY